MTQHIIKTQNLAQSIQGWLLLVVGISASMVSEVQSADIHGTIIDKSGGMIVAARVTLLSANGDKREIVTNGTGIYTFARVAPGEYLITAQHPDFRLQEIKSVVKEPRERVRVDFVLEISDSTKSIDVTDMISLLCTVTDKQGQLITTLRASDFLLKEDGKAQTIARFARQTTLPLTVVVLVDTSLSVQPILQLEKETAKNFLRTILREQDLALVASFNREISVPADFSVDLTQLEQAIDSIQLGRGTSLHQAVHAVCIERLLNLGGRKVIVLISDGDDTTSLIPFQDSIVATQRADAIVFTISNRLNSSDHQGDQTLKKYAADTGGRALFPSKPDELQMAFKAIEQELRGQYSLSYNSSNSSLDGKFRRVKISLPRHPGLKVHAKKGYFAPAGGLDKVSRRSPSLPSPTLHESHRVAGKPSPGIAELNP